MQELNLDDFAAPKRSVTLAGKSYPVQNITVDDFIETTKRAEQMEARIAAGEVVTLVERVEITIETIQRSVPTLPRELLRKLSLEQLGVISRFVRGEDPNKIKEGAADDDVEADEKK